MIGSRRSWHNECRSLCKLIVRVWKSTLADRLFGHAAELGFYFLFALFPTLICGASMLGLVARSAHQISDALLGYLSLVVPTSALGAVLKTFNETAAASSSGKITFGSIAAIWSASVGVSALQDTLNGVFRLEEKRSYVIARLEAISLTVLLIALTAAGLGCMLGGNFVVAFLNRRWPNGLIIVAAGIAVRCLAWLIAACLLALSFSFLYYWAPDWQVRRWRWLTPGIVFGIAGWLLASFGLRMYIHLFRGFSVTYGSLGAVIALLTWLYFSGLMLLLGAEIDVVIEHFQADTG